MNILITGSAGYIGSYALVYLAQAGHHERALLIDAQHLAQFFGAWSVKLACIPIFKNPF